MDQQAEILLDAGLAAYLAEDPELNVRIHETDSAGKTQAIRLALPDVVTVITLVAAAAEIADRLSRLARRTKAWMRAQRVATTSLVVRGEDDDWLLEVTEASDPDAVALVLVRGVYEEQPHDSA